MQHGSHVEPMAQTLAEKILSITNQSVSRCYQCGKCSAGCPMAEEMDYTPNQILRMLQLRLADLDEKVLKSKGIWFCLACETCSTRCPQEVEFPVVMDFLRHESLRRDMVHPDAKKILAFHRTFLDSIKSTGRLYEIGLIGGYKLRSLNLFQDIEHAPKMFFNGKLSILPHMIKGKDAVERIFKKINDLEKNNHD